MRNFNAEAIKHELLDGMETVHEQLGMLVSYEGKIPRIELDIVMENVRELYENLMKLALIEGKEGMSRATSMPLNDLENPTVHTETSNVKEPEWVAENLAFSKQLKDEKTAPATPHPTPGGKIDLKSLITINDKFLLISGLFQGNLKEYAKTIELLNSINDRKSAFDAVAELQKNYLWDVRSDAFNKLKSIVEKRFSH